MVRNDTGCCPCSCSLWSASVLIDTPFDKWSQKKIENEREERERKWEKYSQYFKLALSWDTPSMFSYAHKTASGSLLSWSLRFQKWKLKDFSGLSECMHLDLDIYMDFQFPGVHNVFNIQITQRTLSQFYPLRLRACLLFASTVNFCPKLQ